MWDAIAARSLIQSSVSDPGVLQGSHTSEMEDKLSIYGPTYTYCLGPGFASLRGHTIDVVYSMETVTNITHLSFACLYVYCLLV